MKIVYLIMSRVGRITNIPHFRDYPTCLWSSRKLMVGLRIKFGELWGSLLSSREPLPTCLRKRTADIIISQLVCRLRGQEIELQVDVFQGRSSHCSHLQWKAGWVWFVTGFVNIGCQLVVQSNCSVLFFPCVTLRWNCSLAQRNWLFPLWCINLRQSAGVFMYQRICRKVCMQEEVWQKKWIQVWAVGGCVIVLFHLLRLGILLWGKSAIKVVSAGKMKVLSWRCASSRFTQNLSDSCCPSKVTLRLSLRGQLVEENREVNEVGRQGKLLSSAHGGGLPVTSLVKIKNPLAIVRPNLLKVRLLSGNGLYLHALPGMVGQRRG